jgi:lipopolysaccharide/colanic/teichoic acid biosynthesis glycosyltransferase
VAGKTIFVSPRELSPAVRRARPLLGAATRARRPITVGRDRRGAWFQVISEELFEDALVRERKRADRFEQTFVLLLLDVQECSDQQWKHVVDALFQSAVDTDVVGWFEQDTVVGLIRPLVDVAPRETARLLGDKVRRNLARRLTPKEVESCSIQWEIYSSASAPAAVMTAGARRTPQQVVRDVAKRALDILGSSALLIALAPVFAVVSALVKITSRGPVMFPQERVGAGGQPFTMMKFRTMHVNADPKIHQQYVENFIQSSGASGSSEKIFKIVDDPRITSIGHFLRRSSLDELPQFWNVLKGEMSLVGPRPPLPYEVARYKNWHRRRVLEAKPGITGLWQVTGRSRTTFDDMVRLDLRYAKRYSVWTDLKILMATPKAVISGKGAH